MQHAPCSFLPPGLPGISSDSTPICLPGAPDRTDGHLWQVDVTVLCEWPLEESGESPGVLGTRQAGTRGFIWGLGEAGSLCNFGCPDILYVDQASLSLRDLLASASPSI